MKYKLIVFSISISISINILNAQNLVPNPSFEEYSDCPEDINYNKKKLIPEDWFSPTGGTADYYNSCSRFNVSVPVNLMGSTFAANGNAYMGLILLEKPDYTNFNKKKPYNYREYVSCKLKEPLKKDSLYHIKFKFAVADFSTYALNKLGLALSNKLAYKPSDQPLYLAPALCLKADLDTIEQSIWYTIEKTYLAKGDEKYLTIGNFFNDENTEYIELDYSLVPKTRMDRVFEDGYAYYYIDNISIVSFKQPIQKNTFNNR